MSASLPGTDSTKASAIANSDRAISRTAHLKDDAALFALLRSDLPALEPIRKAASSGDLDTARHLFVEHLARRQTPHYFFRIDDGPELLATLHAVAPNYVQSKIRQADRVLERDFTIEGDHRQLQQKIEWLQGPVEWTNVLSRFQYWESELVAWWETGDEKYARDFVDVLRDWIESNPPPDRIDNSFGTNGNVWRTLEMGIRGDAWIRAFFGFFRAPVFTDADKTLMVRSLVEHARLLYRHNRDRGYAPGNWQVVEATGLLCIAVTFPEFKESEEWRKIALELLEKHLRDGVLADGVHVECTPGYHNWVAERFLTAARLCDLNGIPTKLLNDKYRLMFRFNLAIAMPDGTAPMVGDVGRYPVGPFLSAGAMLFQDPVLRFLASDNLTPDVVWKFGPEAVTRYNQVERQSPDFTSVYLPDSGFIVMRSAWKPTDRYLFFNGVRYGGGHSHADDLSVDVFADRLLVTDSGRENYNHPLHRRYFRTTRAHNTVMIGGREQPPKVNPTVHDWVTGADFDFARASITYDGFTHTRSVVFVKPDYWVVYDVIDGSGTEKLEQIWNFVPSHLVVEEEGSVHTADAGKTGLYIVQALPSGLSVRREDGWYGPAAGRSEPAPTAVFSGTAALPFAFATVLYPTREDAPVVSATPLRNSEGPLPFAQGVAVNVGEDLVVFNPDRRTMTVRGSSIEDPVAVLRNSTNTAP